MFNGLNNVFKKTLDKSGVVLKYFLPAYQSTKKNFILFFSTVLKLIILGSTWFVFSLPVFSYFQFLVDFIVVIGSFYFSDFFISTNLKKNDNTLGSFFVCIITLSIYGIIYFFDIKIRLVTVMLSLYALCIATKVTDTIPKDVKNFFSKSVSSTTNEIKKTVNKITTEKDLLTDTKNK